jgi:hypothetical protein
LLRSTSSSSKRGRLCLCLWCMKESATAEPAAAGAGAALTAQQAPAHQVVLQHEPNVAEAASAPTSAPAHLPAPAPALVGVAGGQGNGAVARSFGGCRTWALRARCADNQGCAREVSCMISIKSRRRHDTATLFHVMLPGLSDFAGGLVRGPVQLLARPVAVLDALTRTALVAAVVGAARARAAAALASPGRACA